MKIKIKDIERAFDVKLKRNIVALGLDTATKTGYCIAKSNTVNVDLDVGFINVDVKEIKDRDLRNELRYEEIYRTFKNLIKSDNIVVVENVYHSFNAQTTILLSRIGAIAWTLAKEKGCKTILWRTATQARKALGLPCNKKKPIVVTEVNGLLGLDLTNTDEIDAIVLALNGLLED